MSETLNDSALEARCPTSGPHFRQRELGLLDHLPPHQESAMNQSEKAGRFTELHVKGRPVLLYNAWDAGSAKAILAAGAQAIATSSWSVAEAQGYRDGEAIPLRVVEDTISRI